MPMLSPKPAHAALSSIFLTAQGYREAKDTRDKHAAEKKIKAKASIQVKMKHAH